MRAFWLTILSFHFYFLFTFPALHGLTSAFTFVLWRLIGSFHFSRSWHQLRVFPSSSDWFIRFFPRLTPFIHLCRVFWLALCTFPALDTGRTFAQRVVWFIALFVAAVIGCVYFGFYFYHPLERFFSSIVFVTLVIRSSTLLYSHRSNFRCRFKLSINKENLVTSKDLFPEIMLRTKTGIRLNLMPRLLT